ncbi:MAG: L,D-transpeptidase family protein [Nitrospirota bacterium]
MRCNQLFNKQSSSILVLFGILLIMVVFLPSPSLAGVLFQQNISYEVAQGDTISAIGVKFGVDSKRIAGENNLDPAKALRAGQKLRITENRIIPETMQKGILIDIPGRMLYLFDGGIPRMAAPVGLGKPKGNGEKGWETPEGRFTIKGKLRNPDWKVPESIQEEMRREGLAVKESYPPGPKNPVGGYVLQTSIPGILIHETIDPLSVYRFRSHGCVRLLSGDMGELFENVETGMHGESLYIPIKIAPLSNGRVFMEVNKDVYGKIKDMQGEARRLLKKSGLLNDVDWNKVMRVILEKTGVPEEVTRKKNSP